MSDDRSPGDASEELRALRARVAELELELELERARDQGDADRWPPRVPPMVQTLLDALPHRVFWKDRTYRYLGCNQAFAEDAGISSPAEIVGKHDFELSWHEVAHLYRADDVAVVEEGHVKLNYEERMEWPGGVGSWLRTTKVPLEDAEGHAVGVFGCYEHINDRKEAEERLRESEDNYRRVVDEAGDGIFVTDPAGNYLSVNPAGCALLGYTEEELCKLNIRDLVPAAEQEAQPIGLAEMRAGQTLTRTRHLLRKDGATVAVEITGRQRKDGGFAGVARDISARVRTEQERERLQGELRHAQRLETVGRLAGGIAHDFNNLLTVILANAELVRRQVPTIGDEARSRVESGLREVVGASRRAANLTRQLLAFGGRQVVARRILHLNDVVTETHRMLAPVVGEHIEVRLELADDLPCIEADRGHLEQVIVNLVVNACEAMSEAGTVTIATRQVADPQTDAGWVTLLVSDTGHGMAADTRERVFEPFFTTKGDTRGGGLGLSTVHGIVSQSGGTISVQSEPGAGARFEVRLPAVDARPSQIPANDEPRRDRPSLHGTVLLVEDEAPVCRAMERLLRSAGHDVLVANNGEVAKQISADHEGTIHVLVTDVVMPGISGTSLARQLMDERADLRALLMSGYSKQLFSEGQSLPPGVDFFAKPFSPTALLARVADLVGEHTAP